MDSHKKAIGFLLLLPVWIASPFLNDRSPAILTVTYVAYMVAAVTYSLWTAFRLKSPFLGIAAVLTVFAWPILLFFVLYFFGI